MNDQGARPLSAVLQGYRAPDEPARRTGSGSGEEVDEDGGFNTYSDFKSPRSSARYSQALLSPSASSPSLAPTYPPPGVDYDRRWSRAGDSEKFDDEADDPFRSYSDFKRGSARYSQTGLISGQTRPKDASDYAEAPILSGQDWARGEGKRESRMKAEKRNEMVAVRTKRVARSAAGCWGRHWKASLVGFVTFLIALAIVLYFVIPRSPTIAISITNTLTSTDTTPTTSSNPAEFSFEANVALQVDASSNWISLGFSSFALEVRLASTGETIASGRTAPFSVPGRQRTDYIVPITFSGSYDSSTDETFTAIRAACAHIYPTTVRPTLELEMTAKWSIKGMAGGDKSATGSIAGLNCPIEFSSSAS